MISDFLINLLFEVLEVLLFEVLRRVMVYNQIVVIKFVLIIYNSFLFQSWFYDDTKRILTLINRTIIFINNQTKHKYTETFVHIMDNTN